VTKQVTAVDIVACALVNLPPN